VRYVKNIDKAVLVVSAQPADDEGWWKMVKDGERRVEIVEDGEGW
jgi:hypothetical protein